MSDDLDKREIERTERRKTRALIKRSTIVSNIRAIYTLALRIPSEPDCVAQFLLSAADLDGLWSQYEVEDDLVLDCLVALGKSTEYSADGQVELRDIVTKCKSIANHYRPVITLSDKTDTQSLSNQRDNISIGDRFASRLPEIPLPIYHGDFQTWLTFRDRFNALVDDRPGLSPIDKMHYLIGCLRGQALDAIKGIPVIGSNYELAWSTLTSRFHRPRMVAASLIDKLLAAPVLTHESLVDLNKFIAIFDENLSVLHTLGIPDLGSFILFSMAFRCLPIFCRKLFESTVSDDFPTVDNLILFVRSRISILENAGETHKSIFKSSQVSDMTGNKFKSGKTPPISLVVEKPSNPPVPCLCCKETHALESCPQFGSWPVLVRSQWSRDHKLCFICFSDKHWSNRCKSKLRCGTCSKGHHTLLHGAGSPPIQQSVTPTDASLCTTSQISRPDLVSTVVLGTALVHIRDRSGTWQTARALVDSASQISAITVACSNRLGLKPARWTTPVTGLAGTPVVDVKGLVECTVQPRFASEPILAVKAWVLPSITGIMPRRSLSPDIKDRYANLALADPFFHVASPVDILLGADLFPSIVDGRKISVDTSLPTAFNSVFGWILIGPVILSTDNPMQSCPVSLTTSLETLIDKFWHVEEPTLSPLSFTDDGRCEELFRSECKRLSSGRYSVPLLVHKPLSDMTFTGSRDLAIKRFESLERKLSKDVQLRGLYNKFMSEYLALGHMSVAKIDGQYFIPHHAIYRPNINQSKIRVVFDASASNYQCPSLNSCLYQGPKLQQDIVDVLTRFRLHKFAFTADICKMYRQIMVLPEYRPLQHILWRSSPHEKLIEYELNTVTYGMNCAPYLALRVLRSIALDDCKGNESVRNALLFQTYVDDICVGGDTIEETLTLQSQLVSVLSDSCLELKKWSSNVHSVLSTVPVEDRTCGPLPFNTLDESGTKVLGLQWLPTEDVFQCTLILDSPPVYTKRGMLSCIARIFDPLGLFGPAIFKAKHIMQRTWVAKLSWDSPLPPDIHRDWSLFVAELSMLTTLRVPRYVNTFKGSPCYLLGFCDASISGYAAVLYLRVVNAPDDSCVFLIGTKTKLAPLKTSTIPRLELNAALLLAKWMSRIKTVLEDRLTIVGTYAWTDSSIVLSWLTAPHGSFKVYVSNRVHQISVLLPTCRWLHVESAQNPADCASRGVMPSKLVDLSLYWSGPDFIRNEPQHWDDGTQLMPTDELPEARPVSLVILPDEQPSEWFNTFSSYDRLLRIVGYVLRFVQCCKRRGERSGSEALTRSELDTAAQCVIIESQRCHFSGLLKELVNKQQPSSKPLARLSPFLDSEGVIRVGGRLRLSSLRYNCKHPILLAKRSHLALLICQRWHKLSCHAGPRLITALISRQFWIVSVRAVLHSVSLKCTVCLRFDAKPLQPLMADLPVSRVEQCRPFSRVGIDYAGPMQMRELRLRKARCYKVYVAIFVCFAVKAVHLEVVTELSTPAFLAAFDRFVARRGLPSEIFSDCGTNFIGADKQLRALIHSPEGKLAIGNSRSVCDWHFNPPSAPHFGGLWEAAVRSTKRLLVRVIGQHILTYEEFTTVLTRVEAVLNSRPLVPVSNDPHDLDYLSPGHFLINQPLLAVPPRSCPDNKISLTNRWKLLDQCHQSFWRQWSAEYLTTLQQRAKWTQRNPNLQINDMVLIVDNQAPPLAWRLGRVVKVMPGTDGVVRVAEILTIQGHLTRPVAKLIALPNH